MARNLPKNKTDFWVCRDETGVLHDTQVHRTHDATGHLKFLSVKTACRPYGGTEALGVGPWGVSNLPYVVIGNRHGKDRITIVAYRVREAPTCMRCLGTPKVF